MIEQEHRRRRIGPGQRSVQIRQRQSIACRHRVGDTGDGQRRLTTTHLQVAVLQHLHVQRAERLHPVLVLRVVLVVAGNRIDAVAGA
ncbi:hypothetical protein G6F46_015562 [Rhizopus delemar]|nr:hypothetical protein G6F46_015562 [Rhizopus delemar]